RAVGWGKGNSAVGSANAKYGDPGYLYLGSYNSDTQLPNYDGIPFNSRPTSLSYYYKYTPGKDGDSYLAEIALLHKNGDEVIEIGRGTARGSEEITTYQQVTLPIEYNEQANYYKPTHIHLLFKSGDRADNSSFLTVPAFGNLSTGEYIGSQLYIDEIKLNY
ncbi:MAG: PCMD domain-containing protein, partial [Phocaeicola sp.]